MWCWIRCRSAPDSHEVEWKNQPGAVGWENASHITRLLPLVSTYYLVQCRCEISLPLISIIRFFPPATRYTRPTTHARELLYFINYHIHEYKTSRFTPRLYRFAAARQEGIHRPRSGVHGPSPPTNQTKKGFKEVTESSKGKTTTHEDTVLEEGISRRKCQHCTIRDWTTFILNHHLPPTPNKKQAIWEYDKKPSIRVLEQKNQDTCSGAAWYISLEEFFSFSNDQNPRPSNFLSQIARGSGATLSECPFSLKKRTSLRGFLQEKTISRLLFERIWTRLVSPSEAKETRRLCGTHKVSQRYDYKSWALAWHTDRSRKGCGNCYT
jgi:hypothetical protein